MKLSVFLTILLVCASVFQICAEVTATCYMEPNRVPPKDMVSRVTGTVTLSQESATAQTKITVNLEGLTPYSVHGFHVHKSGDIVSNGCQSTGSHYNPFGSTHGAPYDASENRHVGDLGNMFSNADGKIETVFSDYLVSLYGPYSVIGRSLVIHAKIDDLGQGTGAAREGSLKTGNAGARLACCKILSMQLRRLP